MPELGVTEEQLARIEAVRTDLEAAFLDGYGHMRRRDAVEYLLDTYTPPTDGDRKPVDGTDAGAEPGEETVDVEARVRAALDDAVRDEAGDIDYAALQSVARNTEGVKGSGTSAEEMYEAVVEATVREYEPGEPVDVAVGGAGEDDGDGPESTGGTGGGDAGEAAGTGGVDDDGTGSSDPSRADEASTGEAAAASGGGGGSQLQAMMNLLETHDDKWRKATSGDAPYEVDLPDGGTEAARTKDDVKRVLFTNY
jgi:hypothetical protein